MVSRNSITERNAFLASKRNYTLTPELSAELTQWEWDAEWPVVDTDGCLTGEIVGPDPDYTVVDVLRAADGDYYASACHDGTVGSMAMCPAISLRRREHLERAAGDCRKHARVSEVTIAEGPRGWIAVVGLEGLDADQLASMLRQIGEMQS